MEPCHGGILHLSHHTIPWGITKHVRWEKFKGVFLSKNMVNISHRKKRRLRKITSSRSSRGRAALAVFCFPTLTVVREISRGISSGVCVSPYHPSDTILAGNISPFRIFIGIYNGASILSVSVHGTWIAPFFCFLFFRAKHFSPTEVHDHCNRGAMYVPNLFASLVYCILFFASHIFLLYRAVYSSQ